MTSKWCRLQTSVFLLTTVLFLLPDSEPAQARERSEPAPLERSVSKDQEQDQKVRRKRRKSRNTVLSRPIRIASTTGEQFTPLSEKFREGPFESLPARLLESTRLVNTDFVGLSSIWRNASLLRLARITFGADVLISSSASPRSPAGERSPEQAVARDLGEFSLHFFTSSGEVIQSELRVPPSEAFDQISREILHSLGFNGTILRVNENKLLVEIFAPYSFEEGMDGYVVQSLSDFHYRPMTERSEVRAIFRVNGVSGNRAAAELRFRNEESDPIQPGDLVWVGSISQAR